MSFYIFAFELNKFGENLSFRNNIKNMIVSNFCTRFMKIHDWVTWVTLVMTSD
jgi:hypothetical protein